MNKLKTLGTWALPAALTLIAIVWAVVAIGGTLTAIAHPAFAYSTAVLYDSVWLYGLAMETAHRRQGTSARLPKVIGWLFLPMTVAVLTVHGLLAGDVLAAIVGALVPVLAKMTLIMAIDRDTTRISPRAQAAIDRARSVTRDRIAVSRAIATARADETRAAADIVKHTRKAEAEAATTVHQALEAHAEIIDQHPVPDWHTPCPRWSPTPSLTLSSPGVCRTTKQQAARGFRPVWHARAGHTVPIRHALPGRRAEREPAGGRHARRGDVLH